MNCSADKEKLICNVDEKDIAVALYILKSYTTTVPGISEANHADVDRFARGVGPVSLLGGKSDGDRKIEDLKLLYRAYITNALANGHMEDNKLRNIFGLGIREAEDITIDVTSKVYCKHLGKAFSGGELEMADSKAAFLQYLCDELHFDPQKPVKLTKKFTAKSFSTWGLMESSLEAAHSDICGSLFGRVLCFFLLLWLIGYIPTKIRCTHLLTK
ncbi:hypothetical protein P8452_57334 [Trifolium repens]|nr:hypothetical protein P8452_57334 [Trifolium repens]